MGPNEGLPLLLLFPGEEDAIRSDPFRALETFLECFDDQGTQKLNIPIAVSETLAKAFLDFFYDDSKDLNAVFGERVKLRRNHANQLLHDRAILWDFFAYYEAFKTSTDVLNGTPFEHACKAVAKKWGISPDAVKKAYRRLGVRDR